MNKPLAVWGLLVFIGFLVTHYMVFHFDSTYVIPLWVLLAILGSAYSGCFKKKCSCCSGIWAMCAVESIILTFAILIQLIPISPFYILSIWLISIGSAMVVKSMTNKRAIEMQLGIFWLFSAVFFPFVNNYQYSTFLIGALVLGVPMMLAGILENEKKGFFYKR